MRIWISWYEPSGSPDKGARKIVDGTPFRWWVSGTVGDGSSTVICALVDAADEDAAKDLVKKWFSPGEWRFCDEKPEGWSPGDRFPEASMARVDVLEAEVAHRRRELPGGPRPMSTPDTPPERILPTEEGWWWAAGVRAPLEIDPVDADPSRLCVYVKDREEPLERFTWLAPIPTPEQLAAQAAKVAAGQALADYFRAIDALIARIVAGAERTKKLDELTPLGGSLRSSLLSAFPAGGAR